MSISFVKLSNEGREFLRDIRLMHSLPQRFIKNFDQSTISDWEIGRYSSTLSNLKKYLNLLNIDKSFLLNKKFVSRIEPKFKLPHIRKRRKIKKYPSNDLHIILTPNGVRKIKVFRTKTGSQKAIAVLARLDQGTISKWENGKINPTLNRFKNYLKIININHLGFLRSKIFITEIRKPVIRRMIDKSADCRRKKILPQKKLTKEKGYLLGVLGPGDGWVGDYQIELTVTDKDFAQAFKENVEFVYGIKSKIKLITPINKIHKKLYKVRVSSKMICDDIRNYKVPFKEKIWRVP